MTVRTTLMKMYYLFSSGFLTIGIPTVRRPRSDMNYLVETVDSLLENMNDDDKKRVTIIIMAADNNVTYNADVAEKLFLRYKGHFNSGLIRVIQTNSTMYPNLDTVKKTYKDDKPRLKWRAKQNIDFAYMMLYSRNISTFYIQIEDDLMTATDFVSEIEKFELEMTKSNPKWFLLEFSHLGFIGKFFHSSDLDFVAKQLLHRYDDRPCDLQLGVIRIIKGQEKPIHSKTSLFQHIGWFSSLEGKVMPLLDDKFKDKTKMETYFIENALKGDNPPGHVFTNMVAATTLRQPIHAYDGNLSTYFWATTPKPNQSFVWVFNKPHNFSRIVSETGSIDTRKDIIGSGEFEYSSGPTLLTNGVAQCVNKSYKKMTQYMSGSMDTLAMATQVPTNVRCLRLIIRRRSKTWLIIRDIQVFFA